MAPHNPCGVQADSDFELWHLPKRSAFLISLDSKDQVQEEVRCALTT
jgi:hypothetical protein